MKQRNVAPWPPKEETSNMVMLARAIAITIAVGGLIIFALAGCTNDDRIVCSPVGRCFDWSRAGGLGSPWPVFPMVPR